MSSSPIATLARHLAAFEAAGGWPKLRPVFDSVPDPRRRRGIRHRLADVLAIAASAVMAGAATFAAIRDWADAHRAELAARGVKPPSKDTVRRLLNTIDAEALDQALGKWAIGLARPAGAPMVVAIDGKESRGAKNNGPRVHLMAAVGHATGVVLGQVAVGEKTNEIPMVEDLLSQLGDVTGWVFTLDALHTQRATCELIVGRGAHYVLTVKANQPKLLAELSALPWAQVPTGASHRDRAHGRDVTRTIKVCSPDRPIPFPHAAQAARVRRTRRAGQATSAEIAHIITDLPAHRASARQIASWVRGHWTIEDRIHWCRDADWSEDKHQAHTGNGPRSMACLRNLAMSAFRLLGVTDIARTLRYLSANPQVSMQITGL
jgi:predicted transposase YbfD/YdcC